MAGMKALGRLFDAGVLVAPVDVHGATTTGKRVTMTRSSGVTVKLTASNAASGTGNVSLVFGAYAAASGGSASAQNVAPTSYYSKSQGGAWVNNGTWTDVTGAANTGGTVTLTGAAGTFSGLYVFDVLASQMPAGFPYLEVDIVSTGTVAQLAVLEVLPHDLEVQRDPANLANLNA